MLILRDRLSHFTYRQACKLLGPNGEQLLRAGGGYEIDISERVALEDDLLTLKLPGAAVTIALDTGKRQTLNSTCSACSGACEHIGAAFALILEEKMALGLAAPPPERIPVEALSEADLENQAISDRAERAGSEKMELKPVGDGGPWIDYLVTSYSSGKTYRVALRGPQRGDSYCSCPDFRKNTLGTCKHIMRVLEEVKRGLGEAAMKTPYNPQGICVHILYGQDIQIRVLAPEDLPAEVVDVLGPVLNKPVEDAGDLLRRIRSLEGLGHEVTVYPDAEEYIDKILYLERMARKVEEIRKDPANHPFRKGLLKVELLPYQLDGIAFAAGAGRAVLADDMGLGKTIQGVGVAEFLAREAGISKVLVVCPASLKSQWRSEILRFSDRTCRLVVGGAEERASQYADSSFFIICNYEQVLRDMHAIERAKWDLIILDEGQRIKNWETRTSQTIKALRSRFALVLSGTPLENRMEDLYSIVEFIDDRRLGPAFRFLNKYRVVDEKGKTLGYKNLDELREALKPVLLRRTRKQVMKDLPARTTDIRRIPPTGEQLSIHDGQKRIIQSIIGKKYISEMDLLRLQKALRSLYILSNGRSRL